jgi:hypothetical protein
MTAPLPSEPENGIVNQTEFARFVDRVQSAISKAIKSGRIGATEDGRVDLNSPLTKAYILETGVTRKPDTETLKTLRTNYSPDASQMAPKELAKELDNQIKQIKIDRERVKYLAEVGEFIPRGVIAIAIGKISSVLEEQFSNFDERHGEQLCAIARATNDQEEFSDYLSREIDGTLRAVIATVVKTLELAKQGEIEQPDEPNPEPDLDDTKPLKRKRGRPKKKKETKKEPPRIPRPIKQPEVHNGPGTTGDSIF